ncbi:hypothetical protein GGF37_002806 [Kickxella alabastrina]|nr:hypothetical protein GGF37_002806 [Kickxella alabastrina]
MLSSGLIEYLMYLLVPVIFIALMRGRIRTRTDSSMAAKKRLTRGDHLVYGSLAVLATLYIYSAIYAQPPNLFKALNTSADSTCSILRHKLAFYANLHPHTIPGSGIPTQAEKSNRDFDRAQYYAESSYGQLDFLVDRFCMFDEDRDVYLKFGEEVFLGSISSEFGERKTKKRVMADGISGFPDLHMQMHSAALRFFTYLPAFALVGLLTTPFFATEYAPSRMAARSWGVIIVGTLLAADLYWLFTVPPETQLRVGRMSLYLFSADGSDPVVFFADSAAYTRKLSVALGLVLFMLLDYWMSPRQTDVQLLKQCVALQKKCLGAAKNGTVVETAVMTSGKLRDRAVALWRREQVVRERVLGDEAFAQTYAKAVKDTKSGEWVSQTISGALRGFGLETSQ